MITNVKVLGVDPGFSVTGYAIVLQNGRSVVLQDSGILKMDSSLSIAKRVYMFHDFLSRKIDEHQIHVLSIETPFLGKNAQNFLKLGYLRGILYYLAECKSLQLFEFSPREVKSLIVGVGSAEKEQVAYMISRYFPSIFVNKKIPLDQTDAIAIALSGLFQCQKNF